MREIKFRAWDKKLKRWDESANVVAICGMNYLTNYEWCQYTGFKDINGKEIYEGDILECTRVVDKEYSTEIDIVEIKDIRDLPWVMFGSNLMQRKIIGNKYENPELLED